jgi:molecular chaperone GrpE
VTVDNKEANKAPAEANADAGNDQATLDAASALAALATERDELKELLLRRQAEFDNYRKRTERERSEYLQYAGMELVRDMLPILDDFDRALKAECGSPDYARGIEMIYSRMYETLKKMGLEPIEATGKSFDPHMHQAVERVETKDAPDGTILAEFQRGYMFKGKMLRPSMVKVAVGA